MKYKLELASAQVCVRAPVCAFVCVFVCLRLCIFTCVFKFVCVTVYLYVWPHQCVCVEGWLILSELGRKQGGCKINGQDKDYCSWKRQKSHYIEFFFCKRRKPKNVFRATEILSTPCVCSPYFTIRNSGTRGVEGIRWWGASLLGIINSGAGGQPGYWRAQVGPYGYLTPAFYYNPFSSSTTSVFVFTL